MPESLSVVSYSSVLGMVAVGLEHLPRVHHLPHKVDVLLSADIPLPYAIMIHYENKLVGILTSLSL